ncbi:ABC transporter ATP-binding protein [Streptomyces sp. MB09-01]|uniref:ABC transporter ATP-binding protein n=1 Tax=Streptomyces sp. MB09-01 TaxID=3028666 RepID=UPI0029A05CF8|nr:ABC transporter ATP-binding protein [Streptomyces sp. MB09-01]MDX3532905.1 ABC transporter ATP-binding protein [Streptomyces sp. MB09-01]
MIWWRVVRLFCQLSPARVTAFALVSMLSAVVPATQIALTAAAVQDVADAITAVPGARESAIRYGLALLGVALAGHVLGTCVQYLDSLLRLELTTKIGERVMRKGTLLDLEQYEDAEAYDNLQRAFQESNGGRVYQVFTQLLEVSRELLTLISVSAVLFSWSPWIALVILVSPVPSVIAYVIYSHKAFEIEYHRAADRRRLYYYQYLTTTDHSFKEIRLFQLGPYFVDLYTRLVRTFFLTDRGLARRQSLTGGLLGTVSVLVSSGAMLWAIHTSAATGQIGQLAGYLQAIGTIQVSAHGMLLGLAALYKDTLFLGNLFEFFALPERRIKGGIRPFPQKLRQGIEFRNVSFVYPGTSAPVLDDVSFRIPAGECVALVGQNGAGKTTIVKLLTRLYEPTGGQILIDGVPVEEYDIDELQRNMGVIFQDFIRYEMSVRDNIGFGRVEARDDDGRIAEAAAAGGAGPVIGSLPQRYDTMLGRHFEEGHQLSGGQWQKIALSRAFMRKAPIVVLDEPTAAIDAEAEAEIFGRLRAIAHEATSLVIAHRFSTVRIADKIIVIERGKLIEQGVHDDLVKAGGVYAHLFHLQASGYLTEAGPR